MKSGKKITVILPEVLLKKAQRSTNKGITETIRKGLELVAAKFVYQKLLDLQGKVKFSIDSKKIKDDRL